MAADIDTDTEQIREWQSIVTLVVFVLANIIVLFPFDIPVYIPRPFWDVTLDTLGAWRVIAPRHMRRQDGSRNAENSGRDIDNGKVKTWVRLDFPMNFVTAPLIGDLFLLAILAIGREEVKGGTIGSDNISPVDIMGFFLTLAYIAISIDASGLIRYLAFRVLQKGGKDGRKLFFYLYAFFFALGSFIGNDPIILSGTAFLAYMTRVSSNIVHPRAWIHTQFAVANIASAILVSSNPANLVLAGAFGVKFIEYTANIIVPVIVTVIVLFPFLLYIVFADDSLIPPTITMHELPEEAKGRRPVNPNIPNARGSAGEEEALSADIEHGNTLSLEEIMNPFLDKAGAAFGAVVMAATLVTVLAINAASQSGHEHPVSYVTVPAAFFMLCWDLGSGWWHRHETREIARRGREEVERARAGHLMEEEREKGETSISRPPSTLPMKDSEPLCERVESPGLLVATTENPVTTEADNSGDGVSHTSRTAGGNQSTLERPIPTVVPKHDCPSSPSVRSALQEKKESVQSETPIGASPREGREPPEISEMDGKRRPRATLVSLVSDGYRWSRETFPTVTAVLAHLPLALVPFAFAMFVLVQALVTKGWVQVFAYGWDHWVQKTGTVGSIGGMAFLSVILCNFSGTNIGTTILLSRVIQTWVRIREAEGTLITNRTFWATVYAMAIGVNYGAFSTAFSASLAGLLWRDILARKHIHVRRLEFARVNLPIIAISMTVGCAVLVGEVYIMRDNMGYKPSWDGH
ncbi:arsenite efflux transporter [Coniochaeta ligniaria NRRL 30616]|uniref:Arsenite efflux transporter n=1 Tax=Coniochaeta ligniaria NRRL 30616 TaxID=1408157 RepID=A0A1J7IEJ2_9PEZI|nr:arsenite efflux transporter [Coniochaeta ligniaria NRRL 30616]